MGIQELLKARRLEILRAASKHGAGNVRIFGSVVRGQADSSSDIDVLVDLEPGRSLLDHAALLLELEQLLGRKVDVVTTRALKPHILKEVMREALPL